MPLPARPPTLFLEPQSLAACVQLLNVVFAFGVPLRRRMQPR
jgi:hypothetical protein